MPPFVLVSMAAIVLAVPLLAWSVLPNRAHQRTLSNLQHGFAFAHAQEISGERRRPGGLLPLVRRLSPGSSIRRIDRLLSRAGRPANWPMNRLLAAKILLPPIVGGLGLLYASSRPGLVSVVMAIAGTLVSYVLPELLLYSQGQKRSKQIGLDLPDTLDQMTIAVEAGLGFDSAMARSGKNGKGPLAEELVRTLQDIQVGQSRRQAYEALARRTDVVDLRRFVRAVIQADIYGIAIADVLRTQASEMRIKRRQRAEEKAMQIPVKVIFPLLLCILPVLFIVLLGPAAMDIVEAFQ